MHPKQAAVAFDVTPETMMKYYTATEKKQTADKVLGGLAGKLLPRKKDETGGGIACSHSWPFHTFPHSAAPALCRAFSFPAAAIPPAWGPKTP